MRKTKKERSKMPVGGNQIIGEFIKNLTAKVIEFSIVDDATSRVANNCREELARLIERNPDWTDESVILSVFPDLQKMLIGLLDVVHISVFRNHAPNSLVTPSQTSNPLDYTGSQKSVSTSCIIIRNVLILLFRIACIAAYRKVVDKRFLKAIELITPDTNVPNSAIADITLDITKGLYDTAIGSIERIATIS